MVDNARLANKFVEMTLAISRDAESEAIARELQQNVIPLADQLLNSAQQIQSTNMDLAAVHGLLVESWTLRAEAYRDMLGAYRSSDPAAFDSAAEKNRIAKEKSDVYFDGINRLIAPLGLHIIQFPE